MANFVPIPNNSPAVPETWNRPMRELDEAISTHDHNPSLPDNGGRVDHNFLTSIGTNTHQEIDAHIGSRSNPHETNLTQAAAAGGTAPQEQIRADQTEAATNDPLTTTSTLVNTLNRIRYRINQLSGSSGQSSSIAGHKHNPAVAGDGGMVTQHGIEYDASEMEIAPGAVSSDPSILDNLGHIRYDIRQLKNGIGFAPQSITSEHIKNKSLSGTDMADHSIGGDAIEWSTLDPRHFKPLHVEARSTDQVKSLVVDVADGVYYLGNQTAIYAGRQTFSFAGLMPTVADVARIDVLYMDSVGQVLRQAGTPGANPSPPTVPNDTLPLVQIYLRGVATTTVAGIYNGNAEPGFTPNDSFIMRDIRPFLNLGGSGEGGGGTTGSRWEPVVDATPTTSANGSITTFSMSEGFISGTTSVVVNGTKQIRVAANPTAGQYVEGVGLNSIVFGTAPANGATIRVSYFKGSSNPIANMVWSSTPGGTINGSNLVFTTSDAFVAGTLQVFYGESPTSHMERLIAGVHYTEDTGLQGFTFTSGNAPASGSSLRVQYARAAFATNNADTVDGFDASATAAPNVILALNSSGVLPASITGTATALANPNNAEAPFYPSQTPTINQIPVLNAAGRLTLPGNILLPIAGEIQFTKNASDPNNNPRLIAAGTSASTLLQFIVGTGGFEFRNNGNTTTLFSVGNDGTINYGSSGINLPNNAPLTFLKTGGTGTNGRILMAPTDVLQIIGGPGGFQWRNNANTTNILSITDAGDMNVLGAMNAGSTVLNSLSVNTTTTLTGAVTVGGALSVSGTLTAQAASGSTAGLLSPTLFNRLNGATTDVTPNTLALRNASGNLGAVSYVMTANSFLSSTPYAVVGRTAPGDGTLQTYNPTYMMVGWANALSPGTADRTKLDSINMSNTTEPNGWRVSYLPNGRRIWNKMIEGNPPGTSEAQLYAGNLPSGVSGSSCTLTYSVGFANAQSVTFGLRWGGSGSSAGNQSGQTAFNITARDRDGIALNARSGWYSINLVALEL